MTSSFKYRDGLPTKTWYIANMQGNTCFDQIEKQPVGIFNRLQMVAMLLAAFSLAGCIPQGAPPQSGSSRASNTSGDPVLATDIDALLRQDAPWEAGQVERNAVTVSQSSYIVKPGDTLRGIGNKTGAGSEALAKANNIEPPFTIFPGQKLTVPIGRYHAVSTGETGIAIARAYGVKWGDIVALNGLEEPYILRIGQRLQLPNAITTSTKPAAGTDSLEKRAAAFSLEIDDIVTGAQPALAENSSPSAGNTVPTRAGLDVPIDVPDGFSGKFIWPANGPLLSSFGSKGSGKVNDGIAIAAGAGTQFVAAGDGVVAYTGMAIPSLGNLILIDHGGGWVTAYGHADQIVVVRGQKVRAGQRLGEVGQTGLVDRPQLHFEVRQNRKPIDPVKRLPAR